ncbi:MAG: hypothetical protein ACYS74_15680 [Planctomycetota bacterium]
MAVVFFRSHIICLCGVALVVEIADELRFAINHDPHGPSLLAPIPGQALVFGVEAAPADLAAIPGVLGLRGGAKIGLSVV